MSRTNTKDEKEILLISYLDYPYPAGLCTRITGLVNILANNRFRVTILAPIARGDTHLPEKEKRNNYYIERINIGKFRLRNSSKFGPKLLQWLIFSIIASLRVAKCFIKSRPLIQYQSTYSAIPALLTKIFLGAKIIGDDIVLIHPLIDVFILKLTDMVVTPSHRTYLFGKRIGRYTLYVSNGVEKNLSMVQVARLKHVILFVGSLSFDQNLQAVENIIRISSYLDGKGRVFEVWVIGGPLNYAEHLLNNPLVKNGKIKFTGIVSKEKLEKLYNASFMGILPFFHDTPFAGGQRTKALEYFAQGVLVISGPEGVKEIQGLKPGKHYLLADSLDEMCTIIDKCLSEPERYRDIAIAGMRYIVENYSWQILTKDYLHFIQSSTLKSAQNA